MSIEKIGLKGKQATEANKHNYAVYVASLKATGEKFPCNQFGTVSIERVAEQVKREQSINEILEFLGKSDLKFANITMLAKYLSGMLQKGGNSCHFATLLRKRRTTEGAPNPYRLLLQKYQSGKYFVNVKSITAEDIEGIRK
jgi:hypothetical protein